jgi:hypothetical protein
VPGKYLDATLAQIQRSQAFTKERGGETLVRETFSAVAEKEVRLSVTYQPGGMMIWATADQPSLPLRAAKNPDVLRVYQEDQVLDVVRSEPMRIDRVSDIRLTVKGELADVLAATSASALW